MEQVAKSPAAVQTTAVGAKQNVFPFEEVFPRPLAELIHALHCDLGFPFDFSATAILTAFAAAIGSTIQLKMKNLFTAIASLNLQEPSHPTGIRAVRIDSRPAFCCLQKGDGRIPASQSRREPRPETDSAYSDPE